MLFSKIPTCFRKITRLVANKWTKVVFIMKLCHAQHLVTLINFFLIFFFKANRTVSLVLLRSKLPIKNVNKHYQLKTYCWNRLLKCFGCNKTCAFIICIPDDTFIPITEAYELFSLSPLIRDKLWLVQSIHTVFKVTFDNRNFPECTM